MFDDILVPTDGSEGSRAAIDRAIELANTSDAALHTIYVVDTTGAGAAGAAGTLDAVEEQGRAAVDEVIDAADGADVGTVEASVARGPPHEAILAYVEEHGIDLVVMGTHGRTGLDRVLLGSTTEKVVRLADVPVMTVPMPAE
jgi:nucleotide-binding universal stress UspA family protein